MAAIALRWPSWSRELLGAAPVAITARRRIVAPKPWLTPGGRNQRGGSRPELEAFGQSEPLTGRGLGCSSSAPRLRPAPYAEDMLRLMNKTPLPGKAWCPR